MSDINKKALTEADIRTKFVTPAIVGKDGGKWNVMTQVREEVYFTNGRVIVRGKTVKRGEAKKADYVLYYKPGIPIAVIEAKDNNCKVGDGMQQALQYAEILEMARHRHENVFVGIAQFLEPALELLGLEMLVLLGAVMNGQHANHLRPSQILLA